MVVAPDGAILAADGNRTEATHDASAHAELLAMRAAARLLGSPRLVGCAVYVTLEPCPMCAHAMVLFRIRRLVYGAYDPKGGGVDHGPRLFGRSDCLHRPEVIGGVNEAACAALLRQFFISRRNRFTIPSADKLFWVHSKKHLPRPISCRLERTASVQIRIGYELKYYSQQTTPMLLMLNVHDSRASDLMTPDRLLTHPSLPLTCYRDGFGNWCTRLLAPPGEVTISADAMVHDSGEPDPQHWNAIQHDVEDLPPDTLQFLLGSRYCETDRLSDLAWSLFGGSPKGWGRVTAICEYVNKHITFGYPHARATRTAYDGHQEGLGVCRDFAHLAVTFCRCMNIPARYCTGYLGDIGVPISPDPMDFSGWFQAYLGGAWHNFDARHNHPRIGRILIGYGRDAADVAISNTFGPTMLTGFKVWTDEIT